MYFWVSSGNKRATLSSHNGPLLKTNIQYNECANMLFVCLNAGTYRRRHRHYLFDRHIKEHQSQRDEPYSLVKNSSFVRQMGNRRDANNQPINTEKKKTPKIQQKRLRRFIINISSILSPTFHRFEQKKTRHRIRVG